MIIIYPFVICKKRGSCTLAYGMILLNVENILIVTCNTTYKTIPGSHYSLHEPSSIHDLIVIFYPQTMSSLDLKHTPTCRVQGVVIKTVCCTFRIHLTLLKPSNSMIDVNCS